MAGRTIEKATNQVFGLGLMTATAIIMLAVTVLLLEPADAATAAVLAVVLGVTTFLVWRFDTTWAVIIGLVVAVAAASTIFYIAFGVFQPLSPIEFGTGLLLVVGFVFALVGGIGALFRRQADGPPKGVRLRLGALALVAIGTLASVVGFLSSRTTVDVAAASEAVVVDMRNFLFEPEQTAIAAGEQLLLTNSDAFAHDFTLEEYDLYTYFGPGSEALIEVGDLPPGTYEYFCSLHTFDGEGMIGTLTIED